MTGATVAGVANRYAIPFPSIESRNCIARSRLLTENALAIIDCPKQRASSVTDRAAIFDFNQTAIGQYNLPIFLLVSHLSIPSDSH